MLARCIGQSPLTILQLRPGLRHRLEDQVWMREGMVPNDVPARRQLANDIGPHVHVPANQKKCRAHVVF